MIIAEFTADHPILRELLATVPDVEIEWEQTFDQPAGRTQMVCWITSDDFEAIDDALEADSTVKNPERFIETERRRLYRVEFTDLGRETNLIPTIGGVGGVLQKAVGTTDGWRCRVLFPDRQAFEQLYRFCREHDIDFTFHRLYEQGDRAEGSSPALTALQRATLIEAVESGYLAIPRECSLAELGDRLGISETAASERFRRAVSNLIEQTLM